MEEKSCAFKIFYKNACFEDEKSKNWHLDNFFKNIFVRPIYEPSKSCQIILHALVLFRGSIAWQANKSQNHFFF